MDRCYYHFDWEGGCYKISMLLDQSLYQKMVWIQELRTWMEFDCLGEMSCEKDFRQWLAFRHPEHKQSSESRLPSGCSNVSHHQQSFSGRTSHEWSNSIQVFVLFTNYLRKIYCYFFLSSWVASILQILQFDWFWEQVVFSPPIWPTQTGSIYHLHLKISQSQSATWRTF